jgi:hypothetical protein
MADLEQQLNYSEIVSIDPISLKSYRYAKNEIQLFNIEKSKKTSFFASYIQSKDVISATIEISRNIPESDLKDAIEIKVYDELGLDSAIDYTITYLETETNDTKNKVFNVFIIDSILINQQLGAIRKKTNYIDYVTTAPFLVASLYKKGFLDTDKTDCFVYFQKNDAFLTIYKNGEFLYSKSLHYSLNEITEKFCELVGERIDDEDFYKLLTTEGLKSSNISHQSFLMQLFGEIFLYINDVLIFARRSYSIEHIDRIYLGSEVGTFIGIDEYAKSYLGLDSHEFNFSIAINSKEWYVDQIHILMALASQVYLEDKDDTLNFSIFKRPPPLKQRPVGKLLGVGAASLIIALAYPAYQFGYAQYLNVKLIKQTEEFQQLNQENNIIKQKLAALKTEKDKVQALVEKESTKLDFRKKLIREIHRKKIAYPMKAQILTELLNILNKHQSQISEINFKNDEIIFFVQNNQEKKITEFIKELTELSKYKISTEKIEKSEDSQNLYLSKIIIGLKS